VYSYCACPVPLSKRPNSFSSEYKPSQSPCSRPSCGTLDYVNLADGRREIVAPIWRGGQVLHAEAEKRLQGKQKDLFISTAEWVESFIQDISQSIDWAFKQNHPLPDPHRFEPPHTPVLAKIFGLESTYEATLQHKLQRTKSEAQNKPISLDILGDWSVKVGDDGKLLVKMNSMTAKKVEEACWRELKIAEVWLREVLDKARWELSDAYVVWDENYRSRSFRKVQRRLVAWFDLMDSLVEEEWYETETNPRSESGESDFNSNEKETSSSLATTNHGSCFFSFRSSGIESPSLLDVFMASSYL
jgi:hypothetical protein